MVSVESILFLYTKTSIIDNENNDELVLFNIEAIE